MENSVIVPLGWMRPSLLAADSVNHRLLSGPTVSEPGRALPVGTVNSVRVPSGVTRPILLPVNSVNHVAPSGPATTPAGWLFGVGTRNSVTTPTGAAWLLDSVRAASPAANNDRTITRSANPAESRQSRGTAHRRAAPSATGSCRH